MENTDTTVADAPAPRLIADLFPELIAEDDAARAALADGKPRGPITGFQSLDSDLGGWLAPGLHILMAEPGAGKTALALQIGAQCGCPCLYIGAEQRPLELVRRTVARTTETDVKTIGTGVLSRDELMQALEITARACPMLAFLDATSGNVLPPAILVAAEGLKTRFKSPHCLIVVDSLTDWAASSIMPLGAQTEYVANEEALNGLKDIANRLACPVLTITHRNRLAQTAGMDRQLFSGKGTGRVEYIAESVWILGYDGKKEEAKDSHGNADCKITLVKNRHGASDVGNCLRFEGATMKFTEK